MSRNGGLLIINADDWGYDEPTTSAISDCYQAGGITSTTAMTFMQGSRFAASQANRHPQLGIGLHLNLVERYSDETVPLSIRDRQLKLIDRFSAHRVRRWTYDLRVRHDVDQVIGDQLERFVQLYGCRPTHLDGHHHCHLAANVLLSPSLPRGMAMRNALSDSHAPTPLTKALRIVRGKLLRSRFQTTAYFFSIATAWPSLTNDPPMTKLGLARNASVEVMVHPSFPHEYEPLQSSGWINALSALPTGTYRELQSSRP